MNDLNENNKMSGIYEKPVMLLASGYTDGYILGTDGKTGNPGITALVYEPGQKELKVIHENGGSENPSFLDVADGFLLAACEQVGTCHVESYRLSGCITDALNGCITDALTGNGVISLEKTGSLAVPGTAMCHVRFWPGRQYASVSNYMSGDLAVIRLDEECQPAEIACMIHHEGVGFDSTGRQEGPHVHSTILSPGGKYLLAADLGLDEISIYEIAGTKGIPQQKDLFLQDHGKIQTPPGMGPRHMAFSPDGKFLYLVTELGWKLYTYAWDEAAGAAQFVSEDTLVPEGCPPENLSADIHLGEGGSLIYASNRGRNDIVVFRRDPVSGAPSLVGSYPVAGDGPRNFAVSEEKRLMAVACQHSGDLLLYALDEEGLPGDLLASAKIPEVSWCGFLA